MIRITRIAAIAGMLAVSSLGSVALTTGVASATSSVSVTCNTFAATSHTSGTTNTSTGTVTGCTGSVATGGSGKASSTENLTAKTGTSTITWANHKTTKTKFTFTETGAKTGQCPTGYQVYVVEKGQVVAGGNAGVPVNQKSTIDVCASATTDKATLAKGQKFTV